MSTPRKAGMKFPIEWHLRNLENCREYYAAQRRAARCNAEEHHVAGSEMTRMRGSRE